jgi:hypothetical protein
LGAKRDLLRDSSIPGEGNHFVIVDQSRVITG